MLEIEEKWIWMQVKSKVKYKKLGSNWAKNWKEIIGMDESAAKVEVTTLLYPPLLGDGPPSTNGDEKEELLWIEGMVLKMNIE